MPITAKQWSRYRRDYHLVEYLDHEDLKLNDILRGRSIDELDRGMVKRLIKAFPDNRFWSLLLEQIHGEH